MTARKSASARQDLVLKGSVTEGVVAGGTVTTAATLALTNGTFITATLTASTACTFTMPSVGAGKSFVLLLKQAATAAQAQQMTEADVVRRLTDGPLDAHEIAAMFGVDTSRTYATLARMVKRAPSIVPSGPRRLVAAIEPP